MGFAEDIASEEGIIANLERQIRQVRVPQRTINWQHANRGNVSGIPQRIIVARRQRAQLRERVEVSKVKIKSLREAILGPIVEDGQI